MTASAASIEQSLVDDIGKFYADPLGFVRYAYPWGERNGPLAQATGPYKWQAEYLEQLGREVHARRFNGVDAVPAIRMCRSTGHGPGKTTLAAWLVDWIMSTRPRSRGTVTANTFGQLQTKTWAAIQTWHKRCITAHWFQPIGGERLYRDEDWFVSAQTCREENSEAFAGQHAATSTSFYIFDEASSIPERIWEVAEGGLIKGEPMLFAFGNPTRNSGKFFRINFGDERDRWNHGVVDSRDAGGNQQQYQEWIDDHGEDSDFVRVRVRGLPPNASDLQFIGSDVVYAAQKRELIVPLQDEPIIAGVDVSGGGKAWNTVRRRKGHDARSYPAIRLPGSVGREAFIAKLSDMMGDRNNRIDAMFIDSAFGAPIVERLRQLGYSNVHEVTFGAASPDSHQLNMRAYMWDRMREWLAHGCIPPKDPDLEIGLTSPGFEHNRSGKLVLESKEDMARRGVASPDDADALALTFARHVAPTQDKPRATRPAGAWGWS